MRRQEDGPARYRQDLEADIESSRPDGDCGLGLLRAKTCEDAVFMCGRHDHFLVRAIEIRKNARNLSNKIARGAFTAGFFISCLIAVRCHTVWLHEEG